MINWFFAVNAIPRLMLFTLPFISLYILSKKLEGYYPTKPHLFHASIVFSLAGFILLATELALGISSLTMANVHFTMLTTNTIFFFLSGLTLYWLSSGMEKAFSEETDRFHELSLFGIFLLILSIFGSFVFFSALQRSEPEIAVFVTIKMLFSLSAFFLLFLSFLKMGEIYRRLGVRYHTFLISAAFLICWQFFRVVLRWIGPIFEVFMPSEIALDHFHLIVTISSIHITITVLTVLLAFLPCLILFKSIRMELKTGYEGEYGYVMEFIENMCALIGESAFTLFRNGLRKYNTEHGTSMSFDPKKGIQGGEMTEDIPDYIANYFETMIGPVARRVYEESKKG